LFNPLCYVPSLPLRTRVSELCTVAMVTMAPGVTGPGAIEVSAGEGALSPPGPSAPGVGMTFRTQVLAKARPTRRATLGTPTLVATTVVLSEGRNVYPPPPGTITGCITDWAGKASLVLYVRKGWDCVFLL
jgi:hypothetical protein